MRMFWRLTAVIAAAAVLSACGGGGDDNTPPPPPPPQTFTVSGTTSGLSGSGLTLQLNGGANLAVAGNGSFLFSTPLMTGASYTVSITAQPANPPQTCVLSNATGSIANASVSNVSIACTDNSYAVGGTVSGLSGSGLVLQDNGGDDLPVSASGNFEFATPVRTGLPYAVTVRDHPSNPSQTCNVSSGTGTVGAADIDNVAIDCTINSFSVGGTTTGLAGSGLVLTLNGSEDLPVATGNFTFSGLALSGSTYAVTVKTQPTNPHQTCVPASATGTVGGGNVTTVAVTCTTNRYTVGGSVSGLTGTGLVLQVNGGQDLTVNANGSFVFPDPIESGSPYEVTVEAQTGTFRERCVTSNASGAIVAADVSSVTVDCTVLLGFVYVTGGDNGEVFGYGIHPQDGALLPLGSTVTVGLAPRDLAATPDGLKLYGTNQNTDTISVFDVDSSSGELSEVGTPVSVAPSDGPSAISIAPSGQFLYVSNNFSDDVALFSIDPVTGGLSSQGVVVSEPGSLGIRAAVSPDGAFLYVVASHGFVTSATVTVYAIDAMTGALTAGATISPGPLEPSVEFDPLGRFLYLHRVTDPSTPSRHTTVLPYTIDSGTGALTAVGSGTTVLNNDGARLTIDPAGQFAYLLDASNVAPLHDHIARLGIDQATGALTEVGARVLVSAWAHDIVVDPLGRFLFAGSDRFRLNDSGATWHDVTGFSIQATGPNTGQLTPAGLGTPKTGQTRFSVITVIE
jgi:6-phosphogluconolactonase (cycloisomerase 2 family)